MVTATPVAADATQPPTGPQLTDRGRVLQEWKDGGPSVKAAAEIALIGGDDQVRLFLGTATDPGGELARAGFKDSRQAALQILTEAGPQLRAAAQSALAGNDQSVETFVKEGWKVPLEQDQRLLVSQIAETAGPRTKAAAIALTGRPVAEIRAFLNEEQYVLGESDDRLRVSQIAESGGPATRQAALLAYEGNLDDVRDFLQVGQHITRARDQEHASVEELVKQAEAAGDQAVREKDAAVDASQRAVAAAALAKEAADKAAEETRLAQGDAARAAAAADRAAEAGKRAGEAAMAATAAAVRANNSAKVASAAASQAAAAAIGAAQATTRALNSAAAAKVDEDAAKGAENAAMLAGYAAKAADRASKAAIQAAFAAEAAASAKANVDATAAAADQAGAYADQAGASSGRAKQAAASARRDATEAARSATAAAALARQSAAYADQARQAAESASTRAARAAESARNSAANAGEAANAAQQADAHAKSARQAADAATNAVATAGQIHQAALASEAEERTARLNAGLARAQDLDVAYKQSQRAADNAKAEALRLDQESVRLAQQVSQPGTDPLTVVSAGRKMALTALKVRGPWSKAAAEYALTGNDEAVVDYVTTGWKTATEQDDRTQARYIAQDSPYESVRTAATAALAGDGAQVAAFLAIGQHQAAFSQYRLRVSQLAESGGTKVKQAAFAAMETNTVESLTDFLNQGQYTARESDDRLTVSQLIEADGEELKIAARMADASPLPAITDFLQTGQYRARAKDELTRTHVTSIENAIAGANQVAALAQQNASTAEAAAATAAGANDQAQSYAQQAAASAQQAASYAQQAKSSADRAQTSANQAAQSAKTARAAQARAEQSARSAQLSSISAQASANAARTSANTAYAAVAEARKSAENAGQSRDAARATAENALKEAAYAAQQEQAQRDNQQQAMLNFLINMPQDGGTADGGSWYDTFSSVGHNALDVAGMFPIVGDVLADGTNCVWTAAEYFGGYKNADGFNTVLTCVNMIPGVGYISLGIKWGKKLDGVAGDLADWAQSKWPWAKKPKTKPGLPSCLNSFPAGTRVLMADGTARPIEAIRPGDQVSSADPTTGESGPRTVADTIYTPDDSSYTELTVTAADGTKASVTATDHHPFWLQNTGQWTDAADIKPGDTLRTDTGASAQVASLRHWTALAPAYNLAVADLHTFHVLAGDTPLLNHNCLDPKTLFDELPAWVKGDKTMGQAFYIGKNGIEKLSTSLESGYTKWSPEISAYLAKKFGKPAGTSFDTSAHVETGLAWMMRNAMKNGAQKLNLNVVINNTEGICKGTTNCVESVQHILPDGSTLRVWMKDTATGRMTSRLIEGKGSLED
ncbi:polymorphic toxin-type HINT domain-containing protein [Kitasatospora sp. NPDC001547]|uniref:polymorphic toxin-type HINT domain-containing protein n=1 Tax=Kitasatospora sp. NPDC001547 TaxID=3364015 RepID=UPI0036CCAAEA